VIWAPALYIVAKCRLTLLAFCGRFPLLDGSGFPTANGNFPAVANFRIADDSSGGQENATAFNSDSSVQRMEEAAQETINLSTLPYLH
jgi:hypothetical protein